jgi:hypothetical protein
MQLSFLCGNETAHAPVKAHGLVVIDGSGTFATVDYVIVFPFDGRDRT